MRRAPVLLLLAALPTACATDQHEVMSGTGFVAATGFPATKGSDAPGSTAPLDVRASPATAAPSALGTDTWASDAALVDGRAPSRSPGDDELESDLRERLAKAADPAPAAIELAALLGDNERHEEALAVLAEARRRSSDARLRIAQASVHRDLGQRHLAVAELRAVCREQGALALHPGLLFEFAELLWLEGEPEAAKATLAELRNAHADDVWCQRNAGTLRALELEIAAQTTPSCVRIRDLLGNLRGAPVEIVRLRTLEDLVALAGSNGKASPAARAASWHDLRERAIAIACGDPSPTLRARAIQLAEPGPEQRATFFQLALADPSALVRRHAAECAAAKLGEGARRLLLDSLEQEQDVEAFLGIHAALASIAVDAPLLSLAECGDAERRAATIQYWKRQAWAL